jgi:hypothetical protein
VTDPFGPCNLVTGVDRTQNNTALVGADDSIYDFAGNSRYARCPKLALCQDAREV